MCLWSGKSPGEDDFTVEVFELSGRESRIDAYKASMRNTATVTARFYCEC